MDQENKIQTEYDEINLMDYVKVILKRKFFILSLFLAAVVAAGVFSFSAPKVYKIDTVLEIGKAGEKTVEAQEQLIGKIESDVYGILIREKLGITKKEYPEIKVDNPKGTTVVKIEIESDDREKAQNILNEKNRLILAEHQEKIEIEKKALENEVYFSEENIKVLQKDIERIEIKISSLEAEKKSLEAKVDALQQVLVYQQDPGTQFALFDTKEKVEAKKQEVENRYLQINSLEGQINDFKSKINSLKLQIENIRPTLVIKPPNVSEEPIKPRPLLNMAIAGILGLFAGTFLAFGKDWWEKSKDSESS